MGEGATFEQLGQRVADFVAEREWESFHTPKDLALALSVEAAELLELFLWRSKEEVHAKLPELRPQIAEELADVFIYGLSMANALTIDLPQAILKKLEQNAERFPIDRYRGRAYE